MNVRWLSSLVVLLFLAPFALAGDAGSPEISDTSGDASNPALDVTSAWFATTGANKVTLTIKLADLSTPYPILNHNTESVRYYYQVDMMNSGGGASTFFCVIDFVDLSSNQPVLNPAFAYNADGRGIGTGCTVPHNTFQVNQYGVRATVDSKASTLVVELTGGYMPLTTGTTLSGVTIKTSAGSVSGVAPGADSHGPTADLAGPGAYTVE